MTLEKLKEEEKDLNQKLMENRNRQRAINVTEWKQKHGLQEGDTVEFKDGNEVRRGVLQKIECYSTEVSYCQKVRLFKKDGTLGDRVVNVFSKMTKANDQTGSNK